jgi:hypothetical protein
MIRRVSRGLPLLHLSRRSSAVLDGEPTSIVLGSARHGAETLALQRDLQRDLKRDLDRMQ